MQSTWICGRTAPDPTLSTHDFCRGLGRLVDNETTLERLGAYLVKEYGAISVDLLKRSITAVMMRDSLQHCGMRESYADMIAQMLTAPGEPSHKFIVPRMKRPSDQVTQGGTMQKKMCSERPTITVELGGPDGLRNLFSKLTKLEAWCTVPPKPSRLSQTEVNTISACFVGAVLGMAKGNMYADSDFAAASNAFLKEHWPLLNDRSGKENRLRTW
tara:strand:+ start:146 stop:790 length:645 start_codon:yes stop_codon:yes gene_type:complete